MSFNVRIVVVPPGAFPGGGGPGDGDPRGLVATLARLGAAAELVRAPSLSTATRLVAGADLLVLDGGPPAAAEGLLTALADSGPPAIAIVAGDDDAEILTWFRLGASECVRAGPDLPHTLVAAALEQLRAWRDTRDRQRARRRIAWLEQLNAAIVKELPAALAVLDARQRVVVVNPAWAQTWDLSDDAARGRPLAETLPAEVLASGRIAEQLARASAGEAPAPSLARWDAPGGARAFDVRVQRLDAAGRLLLALTDVTERETLTKRMADLRRYNDNIIQNMNSALLVIDTDGRVTFANRVAEQILGEPEGSLRDRSVWDWFSTSHADGALLGQTLREGRRYRGAETLLTRADGSVIPIGISCAPLVDGDGSRLGAVAIFQDLTEITLLQQQVLLREKLASIGELAAGVAHEINNPMGFIHANLFQMSEYLDDLRGLWKHVDELREALERDDREGVRRAAARLEDQAAEVDVAYVLDDFAKAIRESQEGSERIRHIVRDLRDFSRQDSDERVPADINQALDSTANIVWSMMKHSVVLRKEYGELPEVHCYPMQLKQVFMNLLVNGYQAIEARLAGSGEIGEIELRTQRRGDSVVISVSDTGGGIPEAVMDRIFDPFFTTKEVGVGTGLGLSTCYNIVRKHGGVLRASNRKGPGATFEVILPIDGGVV